MTRRWIAVLVALVMVLGLVPMTAGAVARADGDVATLGELAPGEIVVDTSVDWEFRPDPSYDGVPVKTEPIRWIVVKQAHFGTGSTLLLTQELVGRYPFHSSSNVWAESDLRAWLRGAFLGGLSADFQSAIVEVTTETNGVPGNDTVFALSATEMGHSPALSGDGTNVGMFFYHADKFAMFNGSNETYWLRTPHWAPQVWGTGHIWGFVHIMSPSNANIYVRPAVNLHSDTQVVYSADDDVWVLVTEPITTYTVTFATDPNDVGANVYWEYGTGVGESGTANTVTAPSISVPVGAELTFSFASIVNSGDVYTLNSVNPLSGLTVTAPVTVTGYYCHYDQIFKGKGIGFWGSPAGQRMLQSKITPAELVALLSSYNLWNENGTEATFTESSKVYKEFGSWVSKPTSKNMSYMLSAHLASMALMVEFGEVKDTDMVFAPSLIGDVTLNDFGFISVENLVTYANDLLGGAGNNNVGTKHPQRAELERVRNVLDWANNNKVLFAASVCPTMPTCSWEGVWMFYDPTSTPYTYYSFEVWATADGVAGTWNDGYWTFTGTVDGNVLTGTISSKDKDMVFVLTLTDCDTFEGWFDVHYSNERVEGFRASPPV